MSEVLCLRCHAQLNMTLFQELPLPGTLKETVVTVGVFDGVHRGHVHLLSRLVELAKERDCKSAVVTFSNNPLTVFRPDAPIVALIPLEERISLIHQIGVDLVYPIAFTSELSLVKARDFLQTLKKCLSMTGLVVGSDFAMGHKREGNVSFLRSLQAEFGFTLEPMNLLDNAGLVASSTAIRTALGNGDIETVNSLLGRNFNLTGTVSTGHGRGKGLGFPTANLDLPLQQAIPKDGVYATYAYVEGILYKSVTSVGTRPTFDNGERAVETHILDFDEEIYDKRITVGFLKRLRDELKFDVVNELIVQMRKDVEQARLMLEDS